MHKKSALEDVENNADKSEQTKMGAIGFTYRQLPKRSGGLDAMV
jgi:hypothetical protein